MSPASLLQLSAVYLLGTAAMIATVVMPASPPSMPTVYALFAPWLSIGEIAERVNAAGGRVVGTPGRPIARIVLANTGSSQRLAAGALLVWSAAFNPICSASRR